jgi:hypothetical protein
MPWRITVVVRSDFTSSWKKLAQVYTKINCVFAPLLQRILIACSLSPWNVHSRSKRLSCWYISMFSGLFTRNDAFGTLKHMTSDQDGTGVTKDGKTWVLVKDAG